MTPAGYDIKSNFAPILNRFADRLRSTPDYTVDIIGHTDSAGSDAVNDPLSINRANATRNYLINRGADGSRIYTPKGVARASRWPATPPSKAAPKTAASKSTWVKWHPSSARQRA